MIDFLRLQGVAEIDERDGRTQRISEVLMML